MHMIRQAVEHPCPGLRTVPIPVGRTILARTRWRGRAADGTELGFDLARPLRHGDVVLETNEAAYVVEQEAEAVVEVDLAAGADAAARLGWMLGNLHQPVQVLAGALRAPDDSAVRALLQSAGVPFRAVHTVFAPVSAGHGPGHAHHHHHA